MANGNRTEWTTEKQVEFLQAVVDSGGNISAACRAVNVSHSWIYEFRKDNPEFDALLQEAVQVGTDVLEDECRRRAFAGCDETVYYQGIPCGSVTKYSDTLAIFLLKGAKPNKYRERVSSEVSGPDGGPIKLTGPVFILPDNGSSPKESTSDDKPSDNG